MTSKLLLEMLCCTSLPPVKQSLANVSGNVFPFAPSITRKNQYRSCGTLHLPLDNTDPSLKDGIRKSSVLVTGHTVDAQTLDGQGNACLYLIYCSRNPRARTNNSHHFVVGGEEKLETNEDALPRKPLGPRGRIKENVCDSQYLAWKCGVDFRLVSTSLSPNGIAIHSTGCLFFQTKLKEKPLVQMSKRATCLFVRFLLPA